MARAAKKSKTELSLEEKLAQALIPEEEWPYKVPDNWCWTFLTKGFAECRDSYRKPINATEREKRSGNVPYYGATGQVGWIDDYLTDEELILLGEDGAPFLDLLKDKAYLITGKAWVNNHAHILKSFFGHIGNLYLLYYLNVFNYTGYVNGTTRLKLTQASMSTIPIPLPPLVEQQRIVDRIESLFTKLNEAKEKAEDFVEGYEDRKAAILHEAFTGELTEKWRKANKRDINDWKSLTVGEISTVKGGKRVPKGMSLTSVNTGHPYIKAGNLKKGTVIDNSIEYVPDDVLPLIKNYIVKEGDVYITNVGACIGDCGVIPAKYDGANLTENAVKMTDLKCSSDYLALYLSSNTVQQMIRGLIASATLGKLSIANIKTIPITLPTGDEQEEVVSIIKKLINVEENAVYSAEKVIDQIDLMKKSILARAFRGELGTNDPYDESAEELLKQILQES